MQLMPLVIVLIAIVSFEYCRCHCRPRQINHYIPNITTRESFSYKFSLRSIINVVKSAKSCAEPRNPWILEFLEGHLEFPFENIDLIPNENLTSRSNN